MARRTCPEAEASRCFLCGARNFRIARHRTQLYRHGPDQGALLECRSQRRAGGPCHVRPHGAGAPSKSNGRTGRERLALLAGLGFHGVDGVLHYRNGRRYFRLTKLLAACSC